MLDWIAARPRVGVPDRPPSKLRRHSIIFPLLGCFPLGLRCAFENHARLARRRGIEFPAIKQLADGHELNIPAAEHVNTRVRVVMRPSDTGMDP